MKNLIITLYQTRVKDEEEEDGNDEDTANNDLDDTKQLYLSSKVTLRTPYPKICLIEEYFLKYYFESPLILSYIYVNDPIIFRLHSYYFHGLCSY